jgi:Ran GTPase-activating protein (RanGAP) involved in mRNA processing and transport
MGIDAEKAVIVGKNEQLYERQKFQLAKLTELQLQLEKLEQAEPNSIGEAGLQDDIRNGLNELQQMKVLDVEERNAIDKKVRGILAAKLK